MPKYKNGRIVDNGIRLGVSGVNENPPAKQVGSGDSALRFDVELEVSLERRCSRMVGRLESTRSGFGRVALGKERRLEIGAMSSSGTTMSSEEPVWRASMTP